MAKRELTSSGLKVNQAMNAGELLKRLEEIVSKHGDLVPVEAYDSDGELTLVTAVSVEVGFGGIAVARINQEASDE